MNDLRKAAEMEHEDVMVEQRCTTPRLTPETPEVTPAVDKAYTKLDTSDRVLHKKNVPQP
jgi:hypothetical protein